MSQRTGHPSRNCRKRAEFRLVGQLLQWSHLPLRRKFSDSCGQWNCVPSEFWPCGILCVGTTEFQCSDNEELLYDAIRMRLSEVCAWFERQPVSYGELAMPPIHYHHGKFPPGDLDWKRLIPLVGPAAAAVARHDATLSAAPNPGILLAPLTMREAVLSSRIEGIEATIGDVLGFEAGQRPVSTSRADDIWEVLNYRLAMKKAEALLQNLPLSQRVVRETHRVLLSGVRGNGKAPGEYRRISNWIGPPGCSLGEATFVPIAANELPAAMDRWENYIHADTLDTLVQLAIIHAEFESLHPFLDGNGRLGRLLIPLFLKARGCIRKPTFYVSAYFERNRGDYYEGLRAVSRDGDWTGWCKFFLAAVQEEAEGNLQKAQAILDLYDELKRRVADLTRSSYATYAVDRIFEKPVFSASDFADGIGSARRTARRILDVLCENGILQVAVQGRGSVGTLFVFGGLLDIVEGSESL